MVQQILICQLKMPRLNRWISSWICDTMIEIVTNDKSRWESWIVLFCFGYLQHSVQTLNRQWFNQCSWVKSWIEKDGDAKRQRRREKESSSHANKMEIIASMYQWLKSISNQLVCSLICHVKITKCCECFFRVCLFDKTKLSTKCNR